MLKPAAAAFILLLVPTAVAAQPQSVCSETPAPSINVTAVFDKPVYNLNADIAAIQKIAKDTGHSVHENITLGITRYEPFIEFHTPVETETFPNGGACTKVRSADVTIGYRHVTVYIAREIPRNSCGFGEVVAHEQKHIDVNLEVLKEYAPRIQERLEGYLKNNGTLIGRDRTAELALLRRNLQALLDDFGARMMNDNIARQKGVDSPEEYARLAHVCGGQLAAVAGRSLDARH